VSFDHLTPSHDDASSIEQRLASLDAQVGYISRPRWCNVTAHVATGSPFAAIDVARRAIRDVIDRDPIAVEVITDAEQARRADD
jgi:hypothetical protein